MIILSNQADNDLEEIFSYSLSNFGMEKAKSYYLGIKEKFNAIDNNLAISSNYSFIQKGLMRSNYQSHAIYYKVEEDSILILRILHQKMEPTRHL